MGISLIDAGWDAVREGKKRKKEAVQEQDDTQSVAPPSMDPAPQGSQALPSRDTSMSQLSREDFQREMTRMFTAMHLELKHLHYHQTEKLGILNEKLDLLNTRVTTVEEKLDQLLHGPSHPPTIPPSQTPPSSSFIPTSCPGDVLTPPITLQEGVPTVDPSLIAFIHQSLSEPIETFSHCVDVEPTLTLFDAVKKGESSVTEKEKEKEKDPEQVKENET